MIICAITPTMMMVAFVALRAAKSRFVVVPPNARISSSVIVTPSAEGATHLQDGINAG
jgi:hypothetical protein